MDMSWQTTRKCTLKMRKGDFFLSVARRYFRCDSCSPCMQSVHFCSTCRIRALRTTCMPIRVSNATEGAQKRMTSTSLSPKTSSRLLTALYCSHDVIIVNYVVVLLRLQNWTKLFCSFRAATRRQSVKMKNARATHAQPQLFTIAQKFWNFRFVRLLW